MVALLELAVAGLIAGWVVYPIAMYVIGRLRGASRRQTQSDAAGVSVLIATRDPIDVIRTRISNINANCNEIRIIEIIVAVDYAAPIGANQYRDALGGRVTVVTGDSPGGKAVTLNAAVRAARGAILIFADSAQSFLPGAMKALVEKVYESKVGVSTGVLRAANNKKSAFLELFWAYELWLRRSESRAASIVAITGAIYAVHRHLWDPLPAGLICDDLYVPLRVIQRGYRVVSCDAAVALDARSFGPRQELSRKVRTLTGMLQMCVLFPSLLNPWGNRAWVQFVFHKLLRIVTPVLIALTLAAGVALIPFVLRMEMLVSAVMAVSALILVGRRVNLIAKALRQLGWSLLFLVAPCIALVNAIRGRWDIWNPPDVVSPRRSES